MEFIDTIHTLRAGPRDILFSFDVVSLFTMMPIEEALRLLSRNFDEAILRLFRHVLTFSFFSFNGQFYEQTDGVAMGSPPSPVIANYFMEYFEKIALEAVTHKSLCWFRYVDDNSSSGRMDPASWLNSLITLTEFMRTSNSLLRRKEIATYPS
jgi:hypothetical protein